MNRMSGRGGWTVRLSRTLVNEGKREIGTLGAFGLAQFLSRVLFEVEPVVALRQD